MKKKDIPLILVAIASISFFIFAVVLLLKVSATHVKTVTEIDKDAKYSIIENDIVTSYNLASKSCVAIYSTTGKKTALGSGVIYKQVNDTFYVVTNYHVIEDFTDINIYYDGVYEDAYVVGGVKNSDIAVLSFVFSNNHNEQKEKVVICDFLNYDTYKIPQIGETTLIIGSPLDIENYNTLTTGVISQINSFEIITDAAINNGNSGGGMFNINGELIGIVYKKEMTSSSGSIIEGRGIALNLEFVIDAVKKIENNNTIYDFVTLPFSFVCINKVISKNSDWYEYLPEGDFETYLVVTKFNNIIGNHYNISIGDCLLKINNTDVNTIDEVNSFLRKLEKGEEVILTLYRKSENKTYNTTFTL